jgi:hypothetical protein
MSASTTTQEKIVGMYVHQHWPYNHPYCARTWTLEDWRGYAEGLKQLGYNTLLVWPMLEIIPDPPTPSDQAALEKMSQVVEMLHEELGMRVYLALCPNVAPDDAEAAKVPIEKRHFFACDRRINPGDPQAMRHLMERREKLLRPLHKADGVSIIDSDPGGYPGSTNQEFVDLLWEHRRLLDRLRSGIELIYWMHAGWLGYNRFYETGVLSFSTDEENLDVLSRLIQADPEPWGLANGLPLAERLGIAHRVILFNYGRIEGEPSFPLTNFGGEDAWKAGNTPGPRGVMGNAQTHCVQLPNTFAFARGAQGQPVTETDYVAFAEDLIPGLGPWIVEGWKWLHSNNSAEMRSLAAQLDAVPDSALQPGRLGGLLFDNPRRFLCDLAMQLRMRAAYVALREAEGAPSREMVRAFAETASAWQAQHGYENTWWWPDLDATLRKIGSEEINAVLESRFDPFRPPAPGTPGTPFERVANALQFEESFTPRLLAALRLAAW